MGDMRPLIFKRIEPILELFSKKENFSLPPVQELLEKYEKVKKDYDAVNEANNESPHPKQPLIVLEGLDGSGKTTVGKRLAKNLNAEQWKTPPQSISHLRDFFDSHPLRTAFYCLGNYIAAYEVSTILPKQSVVMDRFWHSTCAYALAQEVADHPLTYHLPNPESDIYDWPDDLPKPDVVLYLNVSEEVRLQRHSRRNVVTVQENLLKDDAEFRKNILNAYKSMRNPGVVMINGNPAGFKKVLAEIQSKINHLFE